MCETVDQMVDAMYELYPNQIPRGIRQDIQEDQRFSASTATWLIACGNKHNKAHVT